MKLILTQEVTGLGAPGDVVEVKDGYGRNFLIPRGFGIRWTKGGEKTIESIKAARTSREVRDLDHAKEIKAKLEGSSFDLPVRAGEGGRLFGAVTVTDIASAISEAGATVDKRKIIVGNPIKSLGSHQVTVKVHDEVDATVNLNVVPGQVLPDLPKSRTITRHKSCSG
jgi:large subunit ribosomal protein L9